MRLSENKFNPSRFRKHVMVASMRIACFLPTNVVDVLHHLDAKERRKRVRKANS